MLEVRSIPIAVIFCNLPASWQPCAGTELMIVGVHRHTQKHGETKG